MQTRSLPCLWRCLPVAISLWGCKSDAYTAGDAITITSANSNSGIVGIYATADSRISFTSTKEQSGLVRSAAFLSADGSIIASILTDDASAQATFTIGTEQWNAGDPETDTRARAIRDLANSEAGRAILETAAYSYWKAPGEQLKQYRITLLQLYGVLAQYYTPEQKRIRQPPNTLLSSCPLDVCELRSNDAIFSCRSDGENLKADLIFLPDGLSSDCAISEAADSSELRSISTLKRGIHEMNNCYGACGWGCSGRCRTVQVSCNPDDVVWETNPPANGSRGRSPVRGCYDILPDAIPTPAESYVENAAKCANGVSTTALHACTSQTCCYGHDECNRHDTGIRDRLTCQTEGVLRCGALDADSTIIGGLLRGDPGPLLEKSLVAGGLAVLGIPTTGWQLKWFTEQGEAIQVETVPNGSPPPATCNWETRCNNGHCSPAFVGLDIPKIDPASDQANCLVHNCKHGTDCPGNSSNPSDVGRDVLNCPRGAWCATKPGDIQGFTALWVNSEGVWVGGSGAFVARLLLNSGLWTRFDFPPEAARLRMLSMWGVSSSDVWVGGDKDNMFHWDGSTWQWFYAIPERTGTGIPKIWGSDSQNVWAAISWTSDSTLGVGAGAAVLKWNGMGWDKTNGCCGMFFGGCICSISAVGGSGPNDVWAFYDWTSPGTSRALTRIVGQPSGGEGVEMLVEAIWASSPDDAWAVGDLGVIHWNGEAWSSGLDVPTPLHDVWGTGAGDVWAVGDGGSVFHLVNGQWNRIPGTPAEDFIAIRGDGDSGRVWVLSRSMLYTYTP